MTARSPSGRMRGIFSINPPPVRCARAFDRPAVSRQGFRKDRQVRPVGSEKSIGQWGFQFWKNSIQRRPRQKPSESASSHWCAGRWMPDQPADRRVANRVRGRILSRSTTAHNCPGQIKLAIGSYTPGISAVSPPSKTQPASRQAAEIPPPPGRQFPGRAYYRRNNPGRIMAGRPGRGYH